MKRRAFLRDAVVWTGLLWIPRAFGQQSALAPRVRQFRAPPSASGETLQDSYQYQQTDGGSIDVGDNWYWWGYQFVAAANYTLSRMRVWAEQRGSPAYNATPRIYTQVSGEPGVVLTGGNGTQFALSSAPAAGSPAALDLTGFSCSIVSGTTYWLTFQTTGYSGTNNLRLWCNLETGTWAKRNDTGTTPWGNAAGNARLGWEAYGT